MEQANESPDIDVCRIDAGDGDGADLVFDYGGVRISVSFFPSSASQKDSANAEDRLIGLLGRAVSAEVDDDYEDIVEEVLVSILDVGRATFNTIVSQSLQPAARDLHTVLYPRTQTFRFKTISDKACLVPIRPDEAYTFIDPDADDSFLRDFDVDDSLPAPLSCDVIVLESFVQGGSCLVGRVQVEGKGLLCKALGRGLHDPRLESELIALHKIQNAGAGINIRVPKLSGYVKHSVTKNIIGLLREWVPGELLRHLDIPTVPINTRQKWSKQIRETVTQLHGLGVIWGDGKASNVVIDEDDDAWLVDFGGGWTPGWVDEGLAGTEEGDNQAVVQINNFLGL